MSNGDFDETSLYEDPQPIDSKEEEAIEVLSEFFEQKKNKVFYFRQLELLHEDRFFHWITNRALHRIIGSDVRTESVELSSGNSINLVWHKSLRYYRREKKKVIRLVEQYSDPNVGAALGLNGELIVLEGFARKQFVMVGREARAYRGREWSDSKHNMDFIFERDGIAYGVEVKNQLRYPDYDEIAAKVRMCEFLGIKPVFVARMMPRVWMIELDRRGGFGLILKYQLYPLSHIAIAKRVAKELGLPVDAPKRLLERTMDRFLAWHVRNV